MTKTDVELSDLGMSILSKLSAPKAVLWPNSRVKEVILYARGGDGRTHYMAPSHEALELFTAGLISNHGEITPAGIAALKGE